MPSPTPPSLVLVYDANPDALERRLHAVRAAAPAANVVPVSSRAGVVLLAEDAPDDTPVLVDLFATDGVSLDRPGERLIRRLLRNPATAHVRPIAWSAQSAADVVRGVRDAGGLGFVAATLDRDLERDVLQRTLAGEAVWPDLSEPRPDQDTAWETWFQHRFGLAWAPWIEPTLVRLASTRERSAVLDELVALEAARSPGQAASRLRTVARAVAGEHRMSATAVASGASLALSQIAAHRPLAERPPVTVSLEHGARTILASPSLVRAAGLTDDEVDDILTIDRLITNERLASPASPGAPAADQSRHERHWAAGRRAREAGASREDVDGVIAGILVRLDEALGALDDARQEELYYPEGRAAAALRLLAPSDVDAIDGAGLSDGVVVWRGRSSAELLTATTVDVGELGRFSDAVDAHVAGRAR